MPIVRPMDPDLHPGPIPKELEATGDNPAIRALVVVSDGKGLGRESRPGQG